MVREYHRGCPSATFPLAYPNETLIMIPRIIHGPVPNNKTPRSYPFHSRSRSHVIFQVSACSGRTGQTDFIIAVGYTPISCHTQAWCRLLNVLVRPLQPPPLQQPWPRALPSLEPRTYCAPSIRRIACRRSRCGRPPLRGCKTYTLSAS